jgi:hypothetical protein
MSVTAVRRSLVPLLWLVLAAPAFAGVRVLERRPLATSPLDVTGGHAIVEGRAPMTAEALAALGRDTPWKVLVGGRQLSGTLADAARLRLGKRNGRALVRLGNDGRLVLSWTKRRVAFALAWRGAPLLTSPLPSPSETGGRSLPTRSVGVGLGSAQTLFDVPLRVRTSPRRVIVRGRTSGGGTRWGAITVLSPQHGTTVQSEPVELTVDFDGAADPGAMRVLLDGVDVTAEMAPIPGTRTYRALVRRPTLNLGKNQLRVTSGPHAASATFYLSYGPFGGGTTGPLPLLVPIKTRVLTPGTDGSQATDYNVALYLDPSNPDTPTLIPAQTPPDGSNSGFQAVLLRRADLSLVANQSFTGDPDGVSNMQTLLTTPPAACDGAGCLAIVQSLGTIGFTACTNEFPLSDDCSAIGSFLQQLGVSTRVAYANGTNPQIAWSYVGNVSIPFVSTPTGTFFERLTCSGSNYGSEPVCDYLGFPNTSFSASADATPDQIGNLDGVLVRDNFGAFTYSPNGRAVSFSTRTTTNPLGHTITVDGVAYTADGLGGASGGIHLLILDRNTLQPVSHQTFPAASDASHALGLFNAVTGYKSYPYLFIISAFGDTGYDGGARSTWYQTSQLMAQIGGTQQTFYLMNDPASDPPPTDDYTLVGFFVDQYSGRVGPLTGLENEVGAEQSSVIARETERFPLDSDMEGILTVDHEGYYSPGTTGHRLGLSSVESAEILSASLLPPTPWPFPGPDPAKSMAAYGWISQQLCCDDLRATYVNLNVSPTVWLTQLPHLTYDPALLPDSSQADFDAMIEQLTTELQYLALVRQLQANVLGLYQAQQANVALLLEQATNEVVNNLQIDLTTPSSPIRWLRILNDVLGVVGTASNLLALGGPQAGAAGGAIRFATGLGAMIANQVAGTTNTPAGSPLKAIENEEITAADLAARAADDFASTIASLGTHFDRIVTDWGRLKTVGAPLAANQLPWDQNAAGLLLASYDRLVRRELYTQLLQANSVVNYYSYISDSQQIVTTYYGSGDYCYWPDDVAANPQVLFYPSGQPNTDDEDPHGTSFPYDYQWAIWALTFEHLHGTHCPSNHDNPYPNTFGLFEKLDPGNPQALGAYRLWFYTREGYQTVPGGENTPCYDGAGC